MKRRFILIPLTMLLLAVGRPVQVVVNNATLAVPALQQHNRVLVPMRAIFEALGAGVVYTASTHSIVAKTNDARIELQIDSPHADVNGTSIALDAPPRIVGTRTFVPLRFVAQALGAYVNYDNAMRIVTVTLQQQPIVHAPAVLVTSMLPNDGSSLATGYPTIRAELVNTPRNIRPEIALFVDNNDVTSLASFDGRVITYVPRSSLSTGRHTVTFSGDYNGNDSFIRTWSFSNSLSYENRSSWPSLYNQFGFRMIGSPNVFAGQNMQFLLTGPPYGTAYLQPCYGNQLIPFNPSSNGYYYANLQAPYVNSYYSCPVTAIFYDQFGNATYLPYPAWFNVTRNYNPQPTPRPYATLPPSTPTPYPTPTATPATRHILPVGRATPQPTVAPKRIILPTKRVVAKPTVHPVAPQKARSTMSVKPKVTPKPKPKPKPKPTPNV